MNKKIIKIVSVLLTIFLSVSMFSEMEIKKVNAYSYNVEAVMAYAEKHWNDGVGLCAEFVSKCVQAGGIGIPTKTITNQCFDAISGATGVQGQWLTLTSGGYALKSQNEGRLSRGDVVISWCDNGHTYRPHIMLCGGFDGAGYATFYAHNNARHNERIPASSGTCGICGRSNGKLKAKVLHLSNGNSDSIGSGINGGQRLLSDGDYHIVSALDETKGIDLTGNNTASGTNIQLYANVNDNKQVFTVKYLGDGFYSIRHKSSGKSLDVCGASLNIGTNVQLYDWNGTDAQRWVICESANGAFFSIRSKCNGFYMDVSSGSSANGSNINMYSGNESNAQLWRFVADGSKDSQTIANGKYEIISALSNDKCIEVKGKGTADLTNVQLNTWKSTANQVFELIYKGSGFYEITDINSGKAMDLEGYNRGPGTNIEIYKKNETDAQKWIIRSSGDGYYYIICKGSGQYIDVFGANNSDGTNIQGYVGNGTNAQKWKFVKKETCDYKGHNIVNIPAVSPTPTVKGLTEGKKCSVCGKIIVKQNDIPATGHVSGNSSSSNKSHQTKNTSENKTGTVVTVGVSKYKITGNNSVTYISPCNKKCTKATIPAIVKINNKLYMVTEVGNNAFGNCRNIKSVSIGKNVKVIGKNAFYGCKNLKTIKIETKVLKSVKKNAFKNINKNATVIVTTKSKVNVYKDKLLKAKLWTSVTVK